MKKKIIILIMTVVCAFCGTVAFAACDLFGSGNGGTEKPPEGQQPETPPKGEEDGKEEEKPHVHEYKLVIEKPTATAAGSATDKCACGEIDGTVVLPVLTDSRYIKSADTATCSKAGTVSYKITINKVEYRFNVATPATGAHEYSEGVCECGAVDPNYEPHEHSYTAKSDESGHWTECVCGAKTAVKGHSYTYASDSEYHWQVCTVGKEATAKVGHSYVDGKCVCGKADPHVHSYTEKSDESGHWSECACGAKTAVTPHSFTYASDNDYHWQVCSVGKETTDKVEHNCAEGDCICGKEKSANELAYRLSDDGTEYEVKGIGTVTSKNVVIPDKYRGLPVTGIRSYAFQGCDITSVTIPASINAIYPAAFLCCYNLQNVIFEDTSSDWDLSAHLNVGADVGQQPLPDSLYLAGVYVTAPDNGVEYNRLQAVLLSDSAFMADIFAKPSKAMSEHKLDVDAVDHSSGNSISILIDGKYSDDAVFTAVVNGEEYPATLEMLIRKTDNATVGGVKLSLNASGEYTVNGIDDDITDIVIPAAINGKPVTAIADGAFKDNTVIKTVIVPETVSVGKSAFANCANLQSFTMSSAKGRALLVTDTVIGYKAFENSGITEITLADTVKEIDFAFGGCDKLTTLNYNGTVSGWASIYMHGTGNHILAYAGGLNIGGQRVKNIVVNNIDEFGLGFAGTDITSVKIGSGVKKVSGSAFNGCKELVSAEIADGVEIGLNGSLFRFCEKLESVKLPSDMKIIPQSMFESCYALQQINLPKGLTHIDNMAFRDSGLTSIVIPASVVRIGAFAFEYCYDLKGLRSISFEDTAENWQIRPHVNTFGFLQDDPVDTGKWYTFMVNHRDYNNEWLYNPGEAAKTLSNLAYAFLENDLSVDLEVYDSNKDERKFYGGVDILDNGSFFVETDEKSLEFTLSFSIIKPDVNDMNACGWHTGEFGNAVGGV